MTLKVSSGVTSLGDREPCVIRNRSQSLSCHGYRAGHKVSRAGVGEGGQETAQGPVQSPRSLSGLAHILVLSFVRYAPASLMCVTVCDVL